MSFLIHLLYSRVHPNQVGINNMYKISVCGKEPEEINIQQQSVVFTQNPCVTNICFTRMPNKISSYQDCEDLLTCFLILGWYYEYKDDPHFYVCVIKNITEEIIIPNNRDTHPGEYKLNIPGYDNNVPKENIDIIDYKKLVENYIKKLKELIDALDMNIEIGFNTNDDFTDFLDYCRDNNFVRNIEGFKFFILNYLLKSTSVDELVTPPDSPINQENSQNSDTYLEEQILVNTSLTTNINLDEFLDYNELNATYNNSQQINDFIELEFDLFSPKENLEQPMETEDVCYKIQDELSFNLTNIYPDSVNIFNPNSF